MKKILFLLAAIVLITLAACKKEVITPNTNDTEVVNDNVDKSNGTGTPTTGTGGTGTGANDDDGEIVDPNDPYTKKPKKNG